MIVKLEVSASEKIAGRSQYEPNHYSVLIGVEHLDVESSDELLGQARTLFTRAKEAITEAKQADGFTDISQPTNGKAPRNASAPATEKQLGLIDRLAHRVGMSPDNLQTVARDSVQQDVKELSKYNASRLIGVLQEIDPGSFNGGSR
jgi:hypothetical protein